MKFKFGLQKVLTHRKIQEDLAQRDYQEILNVLTAQQNDLQKMFDSIFDARADVASLEAKSSPGLVERVKQIHEFIKLQDIRVAQQQEKIKQTEKLVEAKQEVLRQKAMDKKIIERLKEKQKRAFDEEQRRLQQKELDELVVMRSAHTKEVEET
jgi:flagellar protein FliJ